MTNNGEKQVFKLGHAQLPEAVELALEKMHRGEKSTIKAKASYGFGPEQTATMNLPTEGWFIFEVELVDFTNPPPAAELKSADRIAACQGKRENGNAYFKSGKYPLAKKKYDKALKLLDAVFSSEEAEKVKAMKLACLLNLAACCSKEKDYSEVVEHCRMALSLDANSSKALYRRAQAYAETHEFELAKRDLLRALKVEPQSQEIRDLYSKVEARCNDLLNKEKKIYSNMLKGL